MMLSEYLSQGHVIHKKAKLLVDMKLDNGEKRKKGDVVSLVMINRDGTVHAEDNDWACKLNRDEFETIT